MLFHFRFLQRQWRRLGKLKFLGTTLPEQKLLLQRQEDICTKRKGWLTAMWYSILIIKSCSTCTSLSDDFRIIMCTLFLVLISFTAFELVVPLYLCMVSSYKLSKTYLTPIEFSPSLSYITYYKDVETDLDMHNFLPPTDLDITFLNMLRSKYLWFNMATMPVNILYILLQ